MGRLAHTLVCKPVCILSCNAAKHNNPLARETKVQTHV